MALGHEPIEKTNNFSNEISELREKLNEKNRQLEIEAALEKIRSRSLLMQHSDEITSVSKIFHEQLLHLGIPSEFSYVWLPDEAEGTHQFWASWSDNERGREVFSSKQVTYPLDKSEPYTAACFAAWSTPDVLLEEFIPPEDVIGFFDVWGELLAGAEHLKGENFPEGIYYTEAYMKYGCFGINIRRKLSLEERHVVERFSIEFERAYTRFLELKRAEARTFEARTETALEKVRARTMAMSKSEELAEVIQVVYDQLRDLAIPVDHAGFILDYRENDDMHIWLADHQQGVPSEISIPYFDSPHWNSFIEAKSKGENFFANLLNFEEKNKFYEGLMDLIPPMPEETVRTIFEKPGLVISTVLLDNVGLYIENYSTTPFTEEENKTLMRFGKVFEQTYTRFLDLQKAEAQTREAQVNLAVERVRAKALAMHKSEEILQVVNTLKNEILGLNIPSVTAATIHLSEPDGKIRVWDLTSIDDERKELEISIDISYRKEETHPDFFMREVWDRAEDYFVVVQGSDRFPHTVEWLVQNGYSEQAREFEAFIEATGIEQAYHPTVPLQKGRMSIDMLEEPTPEVESILKKMAQAFDITYKRFEDLQKAEAQAREAKIETALEKVRSRTMGMQKSDELADVADVLFKEMNELVHNLWTCGFVLCEKDRTEDEWWLGLDDGFTRGFFLPNVNDYAHAHLYEGWLKEEAFRTVQLEGDDLQEHYDWLMKIPAAKNIFDEMEAAGMQRPDWQKLHAAYFSKGYLVIITREPCAEESIFKRFAQVFDLTYTRFLDLQKAEAQARESQIELSLERIRARVTAMQESSDLLEIVVTMRSEFVNLGHEAHYFWHMRWNPETYSKAMTSGDGSQIGMVMTLPRHIHGDIPPVAEWEKGSDPVHVLAMETETAVDYVDKMIKLGDFERVDPQAPTLDDIRHIGGLTFVMARTTHGEIGYSLPGVVPEPPADAVETLIRFAKVFDLAYKRFEDLKAAEKDLIEIKEARQKAEEALSELKATQSQLVQQEKLASLGQLTAGIAHEIKNPLNFVKNFSEVSLELIDEALSEIKEIKENDHAEEASEILNDVQFNLNKIHEHGTRANGIVSSMLQHSRGGSGKMEPTDLNALIKEYVNLAFHGMRASKNPINVTLSFDLDQDLGKVKLIGEDFSRVVLNLANNAFDAMREKAKTATDYLPVLSVKTRLAANSQLLIAISDNGPGIPDEIKDKILQPFFTTKKGTEGTGLGLSITNDIVKAHGGEMQVQSESGTGLPVGQTGTTFTIHLKGQE